MKSRLPNNFGSNSMNNMLKQAQKMQAQMSQIQEELNQEVFRGTSGGEAVIVEITGNRTVKSIKLSPDIVCPDEIEMLEDLIIAAFNQAIKTFEEESSKRMGAVTGNIAIPGLI